LGNFSLLLVSNLEGLTFTVGVLMDIGVWVVLGMICEGFPLEVRIEGLTFGIVIFLLSLWVV
jgi:hypothetical protein